MLLGEVVSAQAVAGAPGFVEGPIAGDLNLPFVLRLRDGVTLFAQPLHFRHYRENAIDIWGEQGRLSLLLEGLQMHVAPCRDNRAATGEREIAQDAVDITTTEIGRAFFEMYDDLARHLQDGGDLVSPGASAVRTQRVVEAVRASARRGGAPVELAA
jgi:predicted dehydrogenase